MSNYKEGLDSILQAINNLITPQLVSLKYDKTFRGKITSIIDNGLYEVQVNGRSYTLPYAGTLQVGDIVKVKSPLNNFSDIYIEAIGGSGGGSTTTDYNDLTSKPILNTNYTSSLSPDSSEIIKGTIGLHKISKTGKYSDLIGTPDLDFIPNSEKGVAGGVATLDENSKLPTSQLPGGIVTDPNYVHTDNNFTNALLTKLNGIESGAQVNKIESISKNGEALTITNKNVNIEVPTKLSELENDNNTVTDKDYVHTDNNFTNALLTKLNGIESGAEVNAIAGIKTNGVLQPIVNKIVDISIPTKTSQLTNDSGYIDKNVDDLANYYTETEINGLLNNKADKSSVPTKLSQLNNDTGFITNAVDNLTNYYLKSETYTKTEVNDLIGQIKTISIQVVDTLPTTGESNVIYLVPKEGSKDDIYNEYIWVNNAWELIGSTQIDLTGYATEDWVNTQIANFLTESQITQLINNSLANYYTQEQVNNLLDNKADKSSIPTKTSDLTNDSGYITKSVDNLDNYYTETEINSLLGNKANTSDIPTKTSQLTNDSGYIDNTVNDLENYYKKNETYNQTQVNNLLNNKADKTEIPTKVSELENDKGYISEIPVASATQLGGIKVGDNLVITEDGVLSSIGGSTGTSDYNALSNKPALNTDNSVALEVNAQEEISGTVSLHKVSKTGNYNDLLNKPNIPSKTSDLTNDSGYITNTVDNLTNYYKKAETYNQTEVDNLLGNKANTSDIPTKTSQLTNDSGYITNEVDNLTNYYTETEVNNLLNSKADTSQIPTKVSELDNDTGFITNSTNELTNYYKKTETYNKTEVNNLLVDKADVEDIPTTTSQLTNDSGYITNTVDNLTNYYKKSETYTQSTIDEILREQEHEILTTTSLTHYYKKTETYNQTEVNNLLADKANKSDVPTKTSQLTNDGSNGTNPFISEIPIASSTQLGGIKVGNNLSIEADGTLNASEGGVKSYNDLTDKPVLNTNVSTSQPVSEGETITGEMVLHRISKTGSYNDLLDKPTIPEPSNEVEISQTQPTDTGVELWVDLSENPSGGGQKTYKYKMSGSPMKEVLPGGKITLPCTYKVGAGVLDIYFNGELLILSADAAGSNGHYLEVGTTGSISNEIQLTNDWGTSSDYYLAIVVRGEYGNPNITFKVGTAQYQAEKGMTFNEYTSSSYNVDGFYVYGANHYVYTGDGKTFYPPSGTNLVVGSDTIISGGNYTLNEG